jgi:hypothetical protein
MFKNAGCVDVDYTSWEEPLRLGAELGGHERKVFMIQVGGTAETKVVDSRTIYVPTAIGGTVASP